VHTLAPSSAAPKAFVRPGFRWDSADAYLFDIDGTLLNSRDAVHYFSFRNAARQVLGVEAGIDGVPVHGNTDPGILRAALRQAGVQDDVVDAHMTKIVEHMIAEVRRNHGDMRPELCPSMLELMDRTSINAVDDFTSMGLDRTAEAMLIARSDAPGAAAAEEIAVMERRSFIVPPPS